MTGSQLLSQIRTILDETESGGLYTDTEIFRAASTAQLAVYGSLLPFQPEGRRAIPPLVTLEKDQSLSLLNSTTIISNDGIPVLMALYTIGVAYGRILGFDISIRDNDLDEDYSPSRILKVSSWVELKNEWGLRKIAGRQADVYYYLTKVGVLDGIAFAVAYSSQSSSFSSPSLKYLAYPTDISASTTNLDIIGFDDEIINHAVANLLSKDRNEFAKLYTEKFINGLNLKIQGMGYALQMQNGS